MPFVLDVEHRPENATFIGRWSPAEHQAAMATPGRGHWIIEGPDAAPLGYVITYDVRETGFGIYIKRIAVATPSAGTGRAALAWLAAWTWTHSDAERITLAVRGYNARAIRCYERSGFEVWPLDPDGRARMHDVDPCPDDCLIMRLEAPRRA